MSISKYIFNLSATFFSLFLLLLLPSCGSKENTIEAQIRKIATNPELQNEQGLDILTSMIYENPEAYRAYMKPDGRIDTDKLGKTIERIGKQSNPSFSWDITAYGAIPRKDLRLNLFLERSGSMTAYDARSTTGDFKRAINEFITRFPRVDGSPGSIFIVNDDVYPYSRSFEEFVQEKDIFAATRKVGDPSFTDFARIFEHVLRDTVAEDINVLITDLIYSPRDTEGVTPAKIFNEEESLATSIFQKHSDKSVIVVQLNSDFDGMYYPYNSPQSGVRYKGNRPYYAVITGSAAAIYKLLHDPKYASFIDFATLPGYSADYIFSRNPLTLDYYTLLPRGKGSKGSYSLGTSGSDVTGTGAHTLKNVKGDDTNKATFRIAANLKNIPTAETYLLNPANYTLKGGAEARIINIEPISESMMDARTRRFLEPATHLFTVEIDTRNLPPNLEISLLNSLPEWIANSASTSDSNPTAKSFATTTFGVDKLLEGIYRAYHSASSRPEFFTLRITLD